MKNKIIYQKWQSNTGKYETSQISQEDYETFLRVLKELPHYGLDGGYKGQEYTLANIFNKMGYLFNCLRIEDNVINDVTTLLNIYRKYDDVEIDEDDLDLEIILKYGVTIKGLQDTFWDGDYFRLNQDDKKYLYCDLLNLDLKGLSTEVRRIKNLTTLLS